MDALNKPKKKNGRKRKDAPGGARKDKARSRTQPGTNQFFESSRWIENGLFIAFTLLVVIIGFLGQQPRGPRIILNQAAPTRVVAEFPFSYVSAYQTERAAAAVRAQVPPVFLRSFEPFENFRQLMAELSASIAKTQIEVEAEGEEALAEALAATVTEFTQSSGLEVSPETILRFTSETMPRERSQLINDAIMVLRDLYEKGIYSAARAETDQPQVAVIQLVDEEGRANLPNARSLEEARVSLRVRLNALSADGETARLLFEIFNAGLEPNLFYSESGTRRAIDRAIAQIKTEPVHFKQGDTLVEPGAVVTEDDLERLEAYRRAELEQGSSSLLFNELFLNRLVLTLLLLTSVYIYLRQGLLGLRKRNRALAVMAVSILLNLSLIRFISLLGETAVVTNSPTLSLLPYIAPYALAPVLISVLVGAAPAVLASLIIAVVFGIIQGNSIEFFLVAFLSGVVGSVTASAIRKRSLLVRAGLLAGATAAIAGAAIALLNGFSAGLVGQQTLFALIVGALTGVLAVGLVPVFEQLFKITTDITLLELTDFNHPLLRQMQVEAPGTYHHSLMVANLSENAAAKIGANPLLCRVCSFFHDIGKLVKPEYFVENQRGGTNPHNEKNPSMSALVIKAHVKEGVEMARRYKLPKVITDVIRQHHGTSLIQYFYYQAKQRGQHGESRSPFPRQSEEVHVDESTYRYDGPKPAFKESAIIFFADGVEAASRTLKKVTQPNVEELIDNMFKSRIEDGQLDECPLTFQELDQIRRSFIYTVLNMLHARVEYPKEKGGEDGDSAGAGAAKSNRNEDTGSETRAGDQQPV